MMVGSAESEHLG